jgi:DNA repair protein RecO (recombination protein O)
MAVSWEDEGIVLAVRRFGEYDAIVSLLTETQGRHIGLVKGGSGKSKTSTLQPGNLVKAWWRARLDDQLGNYTIEAVHNFGAAVLSEPLALAGLSALCAMAEATLPEREPHAATYRRALNLLEQMEASGWEAEYVRWELALLRDMGYGLDLASCAATGVTENLNFVSPRSGRAVSDAAAAPYRERLLALPAFLRDDAAEITAADVSAGLTLTAHFFDVHVFQPHQREMPAARTRFAERLRG